ncbi:MAG: MFS transporter [bacterium]|jgi:MFS family permease
MKAPSQLTHDPYGAWRSPAYRLFSAGWLALTMAGQIETVAVGIHLYAQTQTVMALGWMGLVKALPVMLLSIVAGQLADRFNRQKLIIMTQTAVVVASAGLLMLALGKAPAQWFYVCLLLSSIGQALGTPARSAILSQLVPVSLFSNAMAWNTSLYRVGSMVGPVLGGLLLGLDDYTPPALALAFLLRGGGLLAIVRLKLQGQVRKAVDSSLQGMLEGIRFVRNNKIILATITLDMFAMMVGGATYLLPLFARDVLHVGGLGLGFLRAAEALGAIAMAMTIAHMPPIRNAGRAMLWAVALFGAATIMFGISQWFWLSMVAMFLVGASDNISVIVRHTLVQVLTPDHMRGRVSAVNTVFIVVSDDLGGFESGVSARAFDLMTSGLGWVAPGISSRIAGAVGSVVFGGVGAVAAVIGCARRWPEVLRLGSLRDIRPAESVIVQERAIEEGALR